MGKQIKGKHLEYPNTEAVAVKVQSQAVQQVLDLWHKGIKKTGFPPRWGDEIEYAIVGFDPAKRHAYLSMKQSETLEKLRHSYDTHGDYTPEFTQYMVESEPLKPYKSKSFSMLSVEENMLNRRETIRRYLGSNEYPFTISIFPRLGAFDAFSPEKQLTNGEGSKPTQLPNDVISKEGRYQALEDNIQAARGSGVKVRVPLFIDKNTLNLIGSGHHEPARILPGKQPFLEVDGTIYGPGHCGLQVTFQMKDESDARSIHDQLIPLGPIMLALTASTPIYRGYLVDTDARWNQIGQASDDRRAEEQVKSLNNDSRPVGARWSANETYIALDSRLKAEYQIQDLNLNEKVYRQLVDGGLDPLLARHFAHILVRKPVIISEEDANDVPDPANVEPTKHSHYESLSGTVWPHVRFKLPPPDNDDIGWRVEFRAMETQLTDFECASFSVFMSLVRLAIAYYNLNLYMPIERVQENMGKAHRLDAVLTERFHFRHDIQPHTAGSASGSFQQNAGVDNFAPMSVDEIINGATNGTVERFPGLIPIIQAYLQTRGMDDQTLAHFDRYLDLVGKRASGKLWTAAHWMREFVRGHPEYNGDSYVSREICHDMMDQVKQMVLGKRETRMFVEAQE